MDTNVVSEWVKPQPDAAVSAWLAAMDERQVFLSTITIAELYRGVLLLDPGRRRARLEAWLGTDLLERFNGRILSVDLRVAAKWGELMVKSQAAGAPPNAIDMLIAATAASHDLTLATRNIRHFTGSGIALLDPWENRPTAEVGAR